MSGPKPVLLAQPEHCPGAYVMYFYCKYDNPDHPFQMRIGGAYMEEADQVETRGEAVSQMRKCGWIVHRDNTATCPLCAKALRERG